MRFVTTLTIPKEAALRDLVDVTEYLRGIGWPETDFDKFEITFAFDVECDPHDPEVEAEDNFDMGFAAGVMFAEKIDEVNVELRSRGWDGIILPEVKHAAPDRTPK